MKKAMEETGAQVCVAVMSGNFTQRGEPAVYDKWVRAEAAVRHGVNLVVELPAIFSVSSAEYFAKGGVDILEGFGCIDYIAFGSESGDLSRLQQTAFFLKQNDKKLHEQIRQLRKRGEPYPAARQKAAAGFAADVEEALLREPNNILAIEYLKRLKTLQPYTVQRTGEDHHSSASRLRKELESREPERFERMRKAYWALISAGILQRDAAELDRLFSAGAGLGARLKKAVRRASTADELILQVKSKVYTYSRISRLLTQVLLNIEREDAEAAAPYIRILAFDQRGADFLKEVKKKECAALPLLTNINREAERYPQIRKTMEKDILASDIYNLLTGNDLFRRSDYVVSPYVGS